MSAVRSCFNAYCDNGNIPWLLMAGLLGAQRLPLSQPVAARIGRFPLQRSVAEPQRNDHCRPADGVLQRPGQAVAEDLGLLRRGHGRTRTAEIARFGLIPGRVMIHEPRMCGVFASAVGIESDHRPSLAIDPAPSVRWHAERRPAQVRRARL